MVESAARHQNFSRAAEENLVSPSNVSQQIKALENQLNFRIFHRGNNSVTLTSDGAEFVAHVREALDTIITAERKISGRRGDKVLRISVLPTFASRWLLPRIQRFYDDRPDITIHISQSYRPVDFAREDIDLAVRYGDGNFAGLEAHLLFQETNTPVCTPELLEQLLDGQDVAAIEPSDLARLTLLYSDTCSLNWSEWFTFAGCPNIAETARSMHFDSCILALQGASIGLGVAVANIPYVTGELASGRLIAPFKIRQPKRYGWYVVHPAGHGRLERVGAFHGWLVEEAASAADEMWRLLIDPDA